MARKVADSKSVAYFPAGHRDNDTGENAFFIVEEEDGKDVVGRRVSWVKDKPDAEGEPADPENNKGHWVYFDGDDDED